MSARDLVDVRRASADAPVSPSGLPTPRDALVGRAAELAAVRALLLDEAVPVLTLTGPGGVGKTRLALAAARDVAAGSPGSGQAFPDGAAFVDLTPLGDPALVLPAIAEAIGVHGGGERSLAARLAAALASRRFLLVLDNCEHVLSAAPALAALLAACPGLQALATSRAPLRLRGEQLLPVPPLALPDPAAAPDPAALAASAAVALFVARARAADPAFVLTAENAAAVAEVVRRLDGLPLAIELAAAWSRVLPPTALLARLETHVLALAGGPRDLPARQQTMRAAVAWSYDLLGEAEQALFRRLAVFVGGFTLDAAEAAAAAEGGPARDALAGVAALVDASLLRREGGPGSGGGREPRYAMLETVREYALERLEGPHPEGARSPGEAEAVRTRHAEFYAGLAERSEHGFHGPEELAWVERCRAELGNLRAALEWSLGPGGDPAPGLRLAAALWWFWWRRGGRGSGLPQEELPALRREGLAWLERGLARGDAAPAGARARALGAAGLLAVDVSRGTDRLALARLEESLALARAAADPFGLARAQHFLGTSRLMVGEAGAAVGPLEAAVAGFRALGAPGWAGAALCFLATAVALEGDPGRARALAEEALDLCRLAGFGTGQALALARLGRLALGRGDHAEAERCFRGGLAMYLAVDDWYGTAVTTAGLAQAVAARGDPGRAARLVSAAAALCRAVGLDLAEALHGRWLGAVDDDQLAAGLGGVRGVDQSAAWAAGQGPTPAEALAVARAAAAGAPAAAVHAELSPREREVLALVVGGHTNREIAEALFVSPNTVKTHVAALLAKLGAENRAQLAAIATARGLT